MNTTLRNPYYFVKDGIIFDISTSNVQEDPCGKHYKTFDTETVSLKKGTYYLDKNGNRKLTEKDGNFEVSLKTAKETATINANKAVFPYFDVTYKYENGNTETITYWLDNLISDGDKMNGNKFQNKTVHEKDGDIQIPYVEFFKKQCLNKMAINASQGMTLDILKSNNPLLFVGTEMKINGTKAIVSASGIAATEKEVTNAVLEKIKEYGDKILKIFEKSCTVSIQG